MNKLNIFHKFNENKCEIKIPIAKKEQIFTNCDIFIYESDFILVCDADIYLFRCPRQFDLEDIKDIPISFDTEQMKYTCILPCSTEETKSTKEHLDYEESLPGILKLSCLTKFTCITDLCILSIDGKVCEIQSDFPYGFAGQYRGKPKYDEGDLSRICRIEDPSFLSPIKRIIQREHDEMKDFSPDGYKVDFVELHNISEGYDNPMKYTVLYDDVTLTKDEQSILEKIRTKHPRIDVERDMINIDCGLVSILMGICYDIRLTSNDPTCESAWTRSILSPLLSYFEHCDDLGFVIQSFLRRSLIYPLYRNYDLSRLCVEDLVEALKKGKAWILKQLLVTYNCFREANVNRKALNKYFMRHYIWYVDTVMNDEHFERLAANVQGALLLTNKNELRLGLEEVELEMLNELFSDAGLEVISDISEEESGSESDSDGYTSLEEELKKVSIK